MNIKRNIIGPNIFPFNESAVPIPVAMSLRVPQKNESPIPDRGPIKAVLILFIELSSKSSDSEFSCSIAVEIPNIRVTI